MSLENVWRRLPQDEGARPPRYLLALVYDTVATALPTVDHDYALSVLSYPLPACTVQCSICTAVLDVPHGILLPVVHVCTHAYFVLPVRLENGTGCSTRLVHRTLRHQSKWYAHS